MHSRSGLGVTVNAALSLFLSGVGSVPDRYTILVVDPGFDRIRLECHRQSCAISASKWIIVSSEHPKLTLRLVLDDDS